MCGDGERVVMPTDPENRGGGAYQLLTPYTQGVPHVDCGGPSAVTGTNLLLLPVYGAGAVMRDVMMWCVVLCAGLTQMLDYYAGNTYDEEDTGRFGGNGSSRGARTGEMQVSHHLSAWHASSCTSALRHT